MNSLDLPTIEEKQNEDINSYITIRELEDAINRLKSNAAAALGMVDP